MPEVRHLLLMLTEPPERADFRLAWSTFRRRHQAVARHWHTARRAQQQPAPHGTLTVQILCPTAPALTDARWTRVAPLLPPQKPQRGRPAHDHRTILSGMLWVTRTGASWRALPTHFGPWETVYSRYHRWRKAGIWQQILDTLNQDDAPPAS